MNLKLQLTRAFLLSLFFAIAFGCMAFLVSTHKIAQFDISIMAMVQGFESPTWTAIMKFFTFVGSAPAVSVLSLLTLLFLQKVFKHPSDLVLFVVVVGGSFLLNQILKSIFHRLRPSLHQFISASGFSFPSTHSMVAFAFYGVLSFLLWQHIDSPIGRGILIVISTAMILAIGVSRIYLGVHYPSDILGGYFASGFFLAIAIWFYQKYKKSF